MGVIPARYSRDKGTHVQYGRSADTTPYINLLDGDNIQIRIGAGKLVSLYEVAAVFMQIYEDTDSIITTAGNRHLYLKPHGTGKIKFGTHTATGDAVNDGSIDIIDAGGTARKLMTKA